MIRRTTASALGIGLTIGSWLAVAACETPPSAYIPPTAPREVPNLDPPPGIPVMPSAGTPMKKPDGGGGGNAGLINPTPTTVETPTCKADKDCAVSTRIACCTAGDPRAIFRTEFDAMEKECKEKTCDDVEVKGDYQSAKDYIAKCANKSCTLVKKKKKK